MTDTPATAEEALAFALEDAGKKGDMLKAALTEYETALLRLLAWESRARESSRERAA